MLTEYIVLFGVGLLFIVLGLLLWKKQRIGILHDYHCRNVKAEDVPAYTRQMGIAQIVIGAGMCLTGLLQILTGSRIAWAAFAAGLAAGLILMHRAQMRYNGGWFG